MPGSIFLKVKNWFAGSLSVILFIIIWEIAPRVAGIETTFVSPPSLILKIIWGWLQTGEIFTHIGFSLERAATGYVLAVLLAIPLGFLLGGWFATLERVLLPLLGLLEKINPFALFPVFILIFGIGEVSKIAMIFWVSQWPILFNTITGVKNVDPLLIKAARSMGAGRKTLFFKVILPAAAPSIFNGLAVGGQTAFFIIIAAEMLGASSGLGWLVWTSEVTYRIPQLFAATVIVSALGLILVQACNRLERKVNSWKESPFGPDAR